MAQQSGFTPGFQHLFKVRQKISVFGPQIDDALAGPDGIGGNRHSFKHQIRKPGKDDPVFERAWFSFICITDHVFHITLCVSSYFPFRTGRKAGTAATTKAGCGYPSNNFVRIHGHRFRDTGVGVVAGIGQGSGEAVAGHAGYRAVRIEFLGTLSDDLRDEERSEISEYLIVDHHRRCLIIHADATGPLQGEQTVRGCFSEPDAENGFELPGNIVRSFHDGRDIPAETNNELALRLGIDEMIESGNAIDLGSMDAQQVSDILHGDFGDITVFILYSPEDREQR